MVGPFTDSVIIVLFILSVPGTLLCMLVGWTRWKESSEEPRQPPWRRTASAAGLALASASAIAFGGIMLGPQFAGTKWDLGSDCWAIASGLGGACGLVGAFLAIAGNGKCRVCGFIASLLQLFWWYGIFEAMYVR